MKKENEKQDTKNIERARVGEKIRVLVSCKPKREKKNDFCFVPEGELVKFGTVCCRTKSCGCSQSMVGVDCFKATTSFKAEERDLTIAQLAQLLENSYRKAGWPEAEKEQFLREAEELVEFANAFPLGHTLQVSGSRMSARAETPGVLA